MKYTNKQSLGRKGLGTAFPLEKALTFQHTFYIYMS